MIAENFNANGHATNSPTVRTRATALGARLDQATVHERQRALRALLQQPMLTADGSRAAEFGLVRRHADWLRDWFAQNCGWALHVDGELARLRKVPASLDDGTRSALDGRSEVPFSRRRYVLLCLALAALERSDRQTTLGRVADEIVAFAAADPAIAEAGIAFDLTGRDQRRDLVQVMRLLLDIRVLVRVDGDEQQYLVDRGDVLYSINRPALTAMLSVRRGPSTIEAGTLDERIAAIVEEPFPDTDDSRNRQLRVRLTRKLLDDPVVYYDELGEAEFTYLTNQRSRLLRTIHEATGLIPEVRSEGIALVDERGDMTDLSMPEEGTDGHLTLLLAEHLANHIRSNGNGERSRIPQNSGAKVAGTLRVPSAGVPVADEVVAGAETASHSTRISGNSTTSTQPIGLAALHQVTAALIAEHRTRWRKDVSEPGAEVTLTEQAIDRLEALRLVRRSSDGIVPLPAIARYALAEPTVPDTNGEQRTFPLHE